MEKEEDDKDGMGTLEDPSSERDEHKKMVKELSEEQKRLDEEVRLANEDAMSETMKKGKRAIIEAMTHDFKGKSEVLLKDLKQVMKGSEIFDDEVFDDIFDTSLEYMIQNDTIENHRMGYVRLPGQKDVEVKTSDDDGWDKEVEEVDAAEEDDAEENESEPAKSGDEFDNW